jgi:ribosome-associated protein
MNEAMTHNPVEIAETATPSAAPPPAEDEFFSRVETAARAAADKKAQDIVLLRLSAITSFTDYFLICSGNSARQVQAIADEVQAQLKKQGVRPLNVEGYNSAEWVLIDYGPLVVHIFSENARRFYDLERLWRDAEKVKVESGESRELGV